MQCLPWGICVTLHSLLWIQTISNNPHGSWACPVYLGYDPHALSVLSSLCCFYARKHLIWFPGYYPILMCISRISWLWHIIPHIHISDTNKHISATNKMYLHGLRQKQWGEGLCLLPFQIVLYCSALRKFSLPKKEPVVSHLRFRDNYAKNTDPVYSLFFQKQLWSWITSDKAVLPTFTLSLGSWSHTRLDNMLIPGLYGETLYWL